MANQEIPGPRKVILEEDSSLLEKDAIKQSAVSTHLPAQEKHADGGPPAFTEETTSAGLAISAANKKQAKESKDSIVAPSTSTKQTKKENVRGIDMTTKYWMTPTPRPVKLSPKIESFSTGRNISVPGAPQSTHIIPAVTRAKRLKASDFKSEPHWEFEEQYHLDNSTLQSVSGCSMTLSSILQNTCISVFFVYHNYKSGGTVHSSTA